MKGKKRKDKKRKKGEKKRNFLFRGRKKGK
jgi:hypothetical protein